MKVLLDTNALIRWMYGSAFPRSAERILARADTDMVVSITCPWEIALKPKLNVGPADVEAAIKEMGATLLPIKFSHLNRLSSLPVLDNHKDPFDRLLIAQALVEELPIVSSDGRFRDYKGVKAIWD